MTIQEALKVFNNSIYKKHKIYKYSITDKGIVLIGNPSFKEISFYFIVNKNGVFPTNPVLSKLDPNKIIDL